MPTLAITKTYSTGAVLTETDLDNIRTSIQTFINTTKLDQDNISVDAVGQAMTSVGANAIAQTMTSTGVNAIAATMSATAVQSIASTLHLGSLTTLSAGSAVSVTLTSTNTLITSLTCANTGTYLAIANGFIAYNNASGGASATYYLAQNSTPIGTPSGAVVPIVSALVGSSLSTAIRDNISSVVAFTATAGDVIGLYAGSTTGTINVFLQLVQLK